jgi:Protein of unknown function (DUF3455)
MLNAIRTLVPALLPIAAGFLSSLCANGQQVPKDLQPPATEQLLLQVHAKGDQIYTCKEDVAKYTWVLKAPEARLTDKSGKLFGRHFDGPSWEASDGSRITGKAVGNAPSPDVNSIPWLLVTVVSHSQGGILARVTSVQRINTKGGKASASGCDAGHVGREERIYYSADYRFFAPQ